MKYLTLILALTFSAFASSQGPTLITPENASSYGLTISKKPSGNRTRYIIEYPVNKEFDGKEEPGFAQTHIFYSEDKRKSISIPQQGGVAMVSADEEGVELSQVTINYGYSEMKQFLVIPLNQWK